VTSSASTHLEVGYWATVYKTLRPVLSDRCLSCPLLSCLSCLSCLSVTLVYYGQTVGWIRMKLGMEVGLGPDHIVLDADPAAPSAPEMGTATSFHFSAHVYCGQAFGRIRILAPQFMAMSIMPMAKRLDGSRCTWYGGTVCLGPRHVVRDWEPASPTERGTAAPTFRHCGQTIADLSNC